MITEKAIIRRRAAVVARADYSTDFLKFLWQQHAQKELKQSQAWNAGDVSLSERSRQHG
jgi:hypothetical protein